MLFVSSVKSGLDPGWVLLRTRAGGRGASAPSRGSWLGHALAPQCRCCRGPWSAPRESACLRQGLRWGLAVRCAAVYNASWRVTPSPSASKVAMASLICGGLWPWVQSGAHATVHTMRCAGVRGGRGRGRRSGGGSTVGRGCTSICALVQVGQGDNQWISAC